MNIPKTFYIYSLFLLIKRKNCVYLKMNCMSPWWDLMKLPLIIKKYILILSC